MLPVTSDSLSLDDLSYCQDAECDAMYAPSDLTVTRKRPQALVFSDKKLEHVYCLQMSLDTNIHDQSVHGASFAISIFVSAWSFAGMVQA